MEKALQYEYEDIFKSKTRKISSFKSRIVLYFHFMQLSQYDLCAPHLCTKVHLTLKDRRIPLRSSLTSVGHMCPLAHGVHSFSECLDAGLRSFFRLSYSYLVVY